MKIAPRRIQRFEVLHHLGTGGTGSVFRARDPQLERDVAIKLLAAPVASAQLSPTDTLDLRSDVPSSPDDLLREARMMARLSHQNVLPVYEVGLADGAVFLVMEHIDGVDLTGWLARPRSTEQILDVFAQAARGLLAAHERGIVHRDIKPSNMLIGSDGRVRVADFGLSRLTGRPVRAMVRVEDGRGTPRYMAPELWRGHSASPRSDVFALSMALAEALGAGDPARRGRALRERDVPPRLCRAILRGLAEHPAERPELAQLIDAIEDRAPGSRAWIPRALAATLLAAAAVLVAMVWGDSPPTCTVDADILAGRWDPARRVQMRALFAGTRDVIPDEAERVVADLDRTGRRIKDALAGACHAAEADKLSEPQRAARISCLERRAFEMAGVVDFILTSKPAFKRLNDAVMAMRPVGDCMTTTAPPIARDRDVVDRLWRRYSLSRVHAAPATASRHIAELKAIEALASESGEVELAALSAHWLGVEYRFVNQIDDADAAYQRAYRSAVEHRLGDLAPRLLAERSTLALIRGDHKVAQYLADLAADAAKDPATSSGTRAAIYAALGRAAGRLGNLGQSLAYLRQGQEVLQAAPRRRPQLELDFRLNIIYAMGGPEFDSAGVLDLAREAVEFARVHVGEEDPNYALALNVLAVELHQAGELDEALVYRRKALDLLVRTMPAGSAEIVQQRVNYAGNLHGAGQFEAARNELAQLLDDTVKNQAMAAHRPRVLALHAFATFDTGHFEEGLALGTQALDEAIALHGRDHSTTLDMRLMLAKAELEMGLLHSVERHVAALEAGYRADQEAHPMGPSRARRLAAEVDILRGRPRAAEASMKAILKSGGMANANDVANYLMTLGNSLVAQRKFEFAREALQRSLEYADEGHFRPDELAVIHAKLAVAEAGLGLRRAAVARARRAARALARFPGELRAHADVERVLSRQKGGPVRSGRAAVRSGRAARRR